MQSDTTFVKNEMHKLVCQWILTDKRNAGKPRKTTERPALRIWNTPAVLLLMLKKNAE